MPQVNRDLVLRKARLLFPGHQVAAVLSVLDAYGQEPYQTETARVQLAVLRLSNGKLERVRSLIETARGDFRDVLVCAEYPNWYRADMLAEEEIPEDIRQGLEERDQQQYQAWLEGVDRSFVCENCCGSGVVFSGGVTVEDGYVTGIPSASRCPACEGTGRAGQT